MSDTGLRVDSSDGRLNLTLDSQDRQNALDGALIEQLHRMLDRAEADPGCRMIVLSGQPAVFCTGMDFGEVARSNGEVPDPGGERFFELLRRFTTMPKLVVSVVDGRVSGGGVGLVAASDLVLATERATFGLPEALWGLLPCSVLPFIMRRTGFQPAYAMTLTTQPLDVTAALACHLVDQLDRDGTALFRLAARVSKVDSSVIGAAKRYVDRLAPLPADVGTLAATEFARLLAQPSVRTRISNFVATRRLPWER